MGQIAIIGSGSWGTTLAVLVAEMGRACRLWVHDPSEAREIRRRRENVRFLPGVPLPDTLTISADPAEVLAQADTAVLAVPMSRIAENIQSVIPHLAPNATLVSGVKGLDPATGDRVSEVVQRLTNGAIGNRFAVLSGPNLAREVAAHEPSTSVVASHDANRAEHVQQVFSAHWFRTYTSDDVVGVELAGALKNVIAIGAGMVDGLHYGHNAKAALMTRGLAEITRLGVAAGANPLTFAGIAGVGDLFATCTSSQSRNHYIGDQLARGRSLDDILSHMVMVAEGIDTSRGVLALASRLEVEMPIMELVNEVLFNSLAPSKAAELLMARELAHELRGIDRA